MDINWRRLRDVARVAMAVLSVVVLNVRLSAFAIPQKAGTGRPAPMPRETGYAHVEVDLSKQRLLVVDDADDVVKILPVSTGSGQLFTSEGRTRRAITPTGRFTVYHKIAGWRESPLGMLYYPSYIDEGIAIHGSPSVPRRPASHGCIRIPMSAAKEFFEMTPIGTVVLVY
jgi:lipoprotein-anchoring transpeptidase ErfK/SrfK